MSIYISDSLRERLSKEELEDQLFNTELSDDASKNKILSLTRKKDTIIISLEFDRQLLDHLYDFLIGNIRETIVTSQMLNIASQEIIKYKVIYAKVMMNDKKNIKLKLKVDN